MALKRFAELTSAVVGLRLPGQELLDRRSGSVGIYTARCRDRFDEGFGCWALFFRQVFERRGLIAIALQVIQVKTS